MAELMGCMKKMTESIEKQSKAVAEMKESRSYQEHYDYGNKGNYGYCGRFRGNKGCNYRGGYGRGRGYQNDTPIRTRTKTPVTIREAMDMDAPGVVTEGVPTAVVPTEVTLLGVKIL